MYSLIKRDPLQWGNFAADLFDFGRARLGKLAISPGSDCRNYRPPVDSIPHVEWLTAASIRDSEHWFFDYDSVGDKSAGITLPGDLASWLRQAGFSDVYGDSVTWRVFSWAKENMTCLTPDGIPIPNRTQDLKSRSRKVTFASICLALARPNRRVL